MESQHRVMETAQAVELKCLHDAVGNKSRPLDDAFLATLRERGLLSPIKVRPLDALNQFEIVYGHRRVAAARVLGWVSIPAMVESLTDEEAALERLIENCHRDGLTPWQRAEALHDMAALPGYDMERAAATLGWTPTEIRRATALLALHPYLQMAMAGNWEGLQKQLEADGDQDTEIDGLRLWSTGHFELVARYPEATQKAVFERARYDSTGKTVAEIRAEIAGMTYDLKLVPWGLDDDALKPEAGACSKCEKRSGADLTLFGSELEEGKKAKDRCLDPVCHSSKMASFLRDRSLALIEKYGNDGVVFITLESWRRGADAGAFPHVLTCMEYAAAKKGDKGAAYALVVEGKAGIGTERWVKVTRTAASGVPKAGDTVKARGETLEEKEGALERRRRVRMLEKLEALTANLDPDYWKGNHVDTLIGLALVFGLDRGGAVSDRWAFARKVAKEFQSSDIFRGLQPNLSRVLLADRGMEFKQMPSMVNAEEVAKLIGVDLHALRAEVEGEIKRPASWDPKPEPAAKVEKPKKGEKAPAPSKKAASKPAKSKKKATKKKK